MGWFKQVFLFVLISRSLGVGRGVGKDQGKDPSKTELQVVHIKGLKCNVSEPLVYSNISCFPKSYSRTISTLNIIGTTKKPLTDLFLDVKLIFKYGVHYREVMHTPRVDWCHTMENYDRNDIINSPLKQLLRLVEDTAPSAFHKCPYLGLELRNISVKMASVLSFFPTGTYKMAFNVTQNKGNQIAHITIIADLTSPNKDTFG